MNIMERVGRLFYGAPCMIVVPIDVEQYAPALVDKKHIGLYPGEEATSEFSERFEGYKTSKGAIQLPLGKRIDYELITDIMR